MGHVATISSYQQKWRGDLEGNTVKFDRFGKEIEKETGCQEGEQLREGLHRR